MIISDFLDDHDCERALQYLADFGHELMLLQIWAEEDRTPPWTGELELLDAETGAGLKLDFDDEARRRYTRQFDEYAAHIESMAHRSSGRYAGVSTSHTVGDGDFRRPGSHARDRMRRGKLKHALRGAKCIF